MKRKTATYSKAIVAMVLLAPTFAQAQALSVRVPGNSGRRWVNSGRYLTPNTLVQLTATGSVDVGVGLGSFGPEGTDRYAPAAGFPAETARRYGLVVRLTASTTYPEDELRDLDRDFGTAPSFCARQGGNLWLTVNDNAAEDNTGEFNVTITPGQCSATQTPVTPPQSAPDGDIRVTGIEIVQAIQIYPSNLVPLIGYKRTVVRVYVGADNGTRGPWTDVTGRLTVRNLSGDHAGRPIRDRFILPSAADSRGAIIATTTGSRRDSLADSLNFVLDIDQTAPGERQFDVEISSISGRTEANTVNNRSSMRAKFERPLYVSLIGATGGTTGTPTRCATPVAPDLPIRFSQFEAQRRFAENAYPVSAFFVTPLLGGAERMFDNSDCEAFLTAHNWMSRNIDRMFPRGAARAYMLVRAGRVGYYGWCCSGTNGNQVARGNDNTPEPGPTLAHEIGHSYGRPHTWDDASFPFVEGPADARVYSIGNNVGMRTYLGSYGWGLGAVPGRDASGNPAHFDFMSYNSPFWVSPHTYCALAGAISGRSVTCPASVTGGDSDPRLSIFGSIQGRSPADAQVPAGIRTAEKGNRRFVYVAGSIDVKGRVSFEPFEVVQSSDDLTTDLTGDDYLLTFLHPGGVNRTEFRFAPAGHFYPGEPQRFSMYLPLNEDPVRIEMAGRQGGVLAALDVSRSNPVLSGTLAPSEQEVARGQAKLEWKAEDADGDKLTFSVDYSADGGTTWMSVLIGLLTPSALIDFNALPGSDAGMLRVVATDGFRTTEMRSEKPFAVPRKAPSIVLAGAPREEFLAFAGQPLTIEATAWDWEDGPITNVASYVWRSNLAGELGIGSWIKLSDLKPGKHTITVTVTDSDKMTSSAQAVVNVAEPKQ